MDPKVREAERRVAEVHPTPCGLHTPHWLRSPPVQRLSMSLKYGAPAETATPTCLV